GGQAVRLRRVRDGLERDPEVAPGRGGADIDGGHGAHDLEVGGAGGPHASRTAVLDPQVVRADASGGGHHQQWAVGAAGGELIPGGGEVRGDLGPAAVGAEYRGGVGVEVERQGDGGAVDGDLAAPAGGARVDPVIRVAFPGLGLREGAGGLGALHRDRVGQAVGGEAVDLARAQRDV